MSDQSLRTRRSYVVETVEDQPTFVEPIQAPPTSDYEPVPAYQPHKWNPGELKSSLKNKVSSGSQTREASDLPSFFSPPHSGIHDSNRQRVQHTKDADLVNFSSIATVVRDRFTDMQTIAMSVPAFVTVALFMSVLSFFVGRFSATAGKQVAAQENPLSTTQPVASSEPAAALGTPDDIIKTAREEFAKAVTLSKKADVTAAEKEMVSKSILHVLDMLTKGITAYPDVGSLYFERAQVEKMVMESAPTLKAQALADYQKSLELSPLSAAYYVGFADYYDLQSQSDKALENYEKGARLDPKSIDALYPLAKLYKSAGRTAEASALYAQILTLLPSSSSQYGQVQQEAQALLEQAAPVASSSATPVASSSATPQ